jgi:hypothetical protein
VAPVQGEIDKFGFMLSTKGTVYRTTDYGLNWLRMSDPSLVSTPVLRAPRRAQPFPMRAVLCVQIRALTVHKAAPKQVFFMGVKKSWFSRDGGETTTEVNLQVAQPQP